MKLALCSLDRSSALVLASSLIWLAPASAQPAGLPSGYSHLQPPPAGQGTQRPAGYGAPAYPTAQAPRTAAPAPASTPKKSTSTISPKDREQDQRISRLESNVAGLRSGGGSSSGGVSSTLRPSTTHIVKPGDSLWAIATQYKVSPGEIMALNRLKSEKVTIGQSILIPGRAGSSSSTTKVSYKPYHHEVRSGDSASSIAKKYGISRQALMDANPRVDFGGGLIPGSRVIIPGKTTRIETPVSTGGSSSSSGSYTVKPGDSLKAIAIAHGTTTANLAALNGIKDANKLIVGQRLVLPGGKVAASSTRKPSKPASNSDDTTPLPGVRMPEDPPSPSIAPKVPAYPDSTAAKPESKPNVATDSHRGILAYRVDSTDSIESIATQFSTTPQRIREMNHLQPTTQLKDGDEIMVPALGAVSAN
jgi:LysM repeat protein